LRALSGKNEGELGIAHAVTRCEEGGMISAFAAGRLYDDVCNV
jgi:hypothetical protein